MSSLKRETCACRFDHRRAARRAPHRRAIFAVGLPSRPPRSSHGVGQQNLSSRNGYGSPAPERGRICPTGPERASLAADPASKLPLPIPVPVALGQPGEGYPWQWSIYQWLPGEPLSALRLSDTRGLAQSLASFLKALQRIDPSGGPRPSADNFHRGGPLRTYDRQTREAISLLRTRIDAEAATRVWEAALATLHDGAPTWLHGDISSGNLLIENGELARVIDFGCLAVGDPACDLAIAWTWMDGRGRAAFRSALSFDEGMWARGRGWALWKLLLTCAGLAGGHPGSESQSFIALEEVLRGDG